MIADKSHTGIRNVVIIVAMQQEADPFIRRHDLQENVPSPFVAGSPMISYSGKIASDEDRGFVAVHLVWNGRCKIHHVNHVATTAAAISAYAAIAHFKPDAVISAGTAGGFSELGARIGDVYLSTKCVFHGRRIPVSLSHNKDKGHLEEYGFGHFRSPAMPKLAKAIDVKQGVVSSSDSLDCSEMDLQLLRSEGAVAKEMEAAAVAWVSQQLYTPFFALKAITDIVDGPHRSEDEFYRNLELASSALQEKLSTLLKTIAGTELNSWQYGSNSRERGSDVEVIDSCIAKSAAKISEVVAYEIDSTCASVGRSSSSSNKKKIDLSTDFSALFLPTPNFRWQGFLMGLIFGVVTYGTAIKLFKK